MPGHDDLVLIDYCNILTDVAILGRLFEAQLFFLGYGELSGGGNQIEQFKPNDASPSTVVDQSTPAAADGSETLGTPSVLAVDPSDGTLFLANSCSDTCTLGQVVEELTGSGDSASLVDIARGGQWDVTGLTIEKVLEKEVPEHDQMRRFIAQLRSMEPTDTGYDNTFMELMRTVIHHVADEETMLLPAAERLMPDRLGELGAQMTKRRFAVASTKSTASWQVDASPQRLVV